LSLQHPAFFKPDIDPLAQPTSDPPASRSRGRTAFNHRQYPSSWRIPICDPSLAAMATTAIKSSDLPTASVLPIAPDDEVSWKGQSERPRITLALEVPRLTFARPIQSSQVDRVRAGRCQCGVVDIIARTSWMVLAVGPGSPTGSSTPC
jgi:hypothetical protein